MPPGDTTTENPGTLAITPSDLKYFQVVEKVRHQLSDGCNTIKDACAAAGVTRRLFYDAIKSPYVQDKLVEDIAARRHATHEVLERSWIQALLRLTRIIQGGDDRDSINAMRLLREIEKDVQGIEKAEKGSQRSVARDLMAAYRVKIELTPHDAVEGEFTVLPTAPVDVPHSTETHVRA